MVRYISLESPEMTIRSSVSDPPSTPTFTISGKSVADVVSIIEGNSQAIRCQSTSNPVPEYIWTYPGGSYSRQVIEISSVHRSRSGGYTCGVTNTMNPTTGDRVAGSNSSSVELQVLCK